MVTKRRSDWAVWRVTLLAALLAAGCGAGVSTTTASPAGPTPAASLATAALIGTGPAQLTATPAADSATAAPPTPPGAAPTDLGQATPLTPTPRPRPSATAVLGSISAANAVSVTQVAVLGPALAVSGTVTATTGLRLEEVVWGPAGASAAGGQIAVAGAPGVLVYDRATGALAQAITTTAWATTLAFSLEGRALAAGTVNATVEVYAVRTGELLAVLGGPGVQVAQVRYLPVRGSVLAAGYAVVSLGVNNTLHFWDVALRAYLGPLELGPSAALGFDLSPRAPAERQWLAAAAGSGVKVWALADLLPAAPAFDTVPPALTLAQPAPIASLALSADGRWLAVGNTRGTVLVWDLAAPGDPPAQTLDRQAAPAEQLAFSPDSAVLASAHADRLIRLWAVGGGARPLAVLAGHTDRLTSLAFSPDGRELASTGWEGVVRVWGLAGP